MSIKCSTDISYIHYNYSVRLTYFYILQHNYILNDTWIPAHSLPQKSYFVYLKNYNKLRIFIFTMSVYLISKGLVVGKTVRLAAGLYHYQVSFVYSPITFNICQPKTVFSTLKLCIRIHPFKHLFTEHLIHARHVLRIKQQQVLELEP